MSSTSKSVSDGMNIANENIAQQRKLVVWFRDPGSPSYKKKELYGRDCTMLPHR
jgi:hypothetical protein